MIIPGRTTEKVQKQVVAVLVQGDGWVRIRPGSFRIADFAWAKGQPVEGGYSCEPTGGRPGNRMQGPLRYLVAVEVESSDQPELHETLASRYFGRPMVTVPAPGPRLARGDEPDDDEPAPDEPDSEDPEPAL